MAAPESRAHAAPLPAKAWPKPKSQFREMAEALGVALLLALFIRTFFVQAFKIPSGSMLPTLQIGDHILVNKFLYGARIEIPFTQLSLGRLPGFRDPKPGDVIVFVYPKNREQDFIKRVIAVEGQQIQVVRKQVMIDGKPWDDPHADRAVAPSHGDNFGPETVPAGHVFVMGDNRNNSYDSRFWGFVPVEDIKGQAVIIYFSWNGPGEMLAMPVRGVQRLLSAIAHLGWDDERWVRWDRLGRLVY